MNYLPSISLIIGYVFIICLTFTTLGYILKNRNKYGTKLIAYLNISTTVNSGLIFSTLYLFSVVIYVSKAVNLVLWKISVISGFVSLIITSIIYSFFKEYRKIQIVPMLIISILLGVIIGLLFLPESVVISITTPPSLPFTIIHVSTINYLFNFLTAFIVIIFQIIITLYFIYVSIYINLKSPNQKENMLITLNTSIFVSPIVFYIFYIIFQETLFRELFIVLIWITSLAVDIMLILKPELFFVIPNKVFSLNIYHKSGILLYSYEFEKNKEILNDSKIWGNIIIGLNHILSEFVDKKDKIDVLQTKKADIVISYDNEYNFAVVVISNKKNMILENIIHQFSGEFKSFYNEELGEIQDLNRLINVSEFKDTKQIIEKNFQLYL